MSEKCDPGSSSGKIYKCLMSILSEFLMQFVPRRFSLQRSQKKNVGVVIGTIPF